MLIPGNFLPMLERGIVALESIAGSLEKIANPMQTVYFQDPLAGKSVEEAVEHLKTHRVGVEFSELVTDIEVVKVEDIKAGMKYALADHGGYLEALESAQVSKDEDSVKIKVRVYPDQGTDVRYYERGQEQKVFN